MEDFGSSILKYYELIKGMLYISFFLIIAWYFYARAGSSYSMMSRVWSLLVGKDSFSSSQMTELMQEREDIDKFNFIFNVKASNIKQINRLLKRIKKQDLNIKLISNSKGHFYINTCKLKVPKAKNIILSLLISMVLFLCIFPLLQVAARPAAALKFHDSNTWFWVNKQYVEKYIPSIPLASLFFDNWRFDKETCISENFSAEKLSATTKLTIKEINATCGMLRNGDGSQRINQVIKSQKVFYIISFIPLILAILSFREFMYMILSFDLLNALLKKKGKLKLRRNTKYVGS